MKLATAFVVIAAILVWISPATAQQGGADFAARLKEASAKPTPRTPDGHPNLTGLWAPDRRFVGFDTVPIERSADGKTVVYAERDEDQTHAFRIVPIGAKHGEDLDPVPLGHSVASWDGDTLVVDVVAIDPETWLDGDGDFHSDALHVIERFTRKGDTLEYDVT